MIFLHGLSSEREHIPDGAVSSQGNSTHDTNHLPSCLVMNDKRLGRSRDSCRGTGYITKQRNFKPRKCMGVKFDVDYTNPQIPTFSHEFEFNVALRPQRPYGPLGTGSPGRPPRLSHSSGGNLFVQCCFTATETGSTGRPPRLSHSS